MDINEEIFEAPETEYFPDAEKSDVQAMIAQGLRLHRTPDPHAHPIRNDLLRLRTRLPFVPIMPFPRSNYIAKLAPGVAQTINIPDGAVLMKLTGMVPFFASEKGAADGIDSVTAQGTGNPMFSVNSLMPASSDDWFYCTNFKALSVISFAIGNIVGAQFILKDEI